MPAVGNYSSRFHRWIILLLTISLLLPVSFVLFVDQAQAHATAERFEPEPGARLDAAPEFVRIEFNEPIEVGIGGLDVLDSMSRSVAPVQQSLSDDRRAVTLSLPKLQEDVYTVAYRIISSDGHPISGSYIFVVGDPPAAKDASLFDMHKELGHHGHGASTQVTQEEFILYASRSLYYAALLFATGLMLWFGLLRNKSEVHRRLFDKCGLWMIRALLLTSLIYVFLHAKELMIGLPISDWAVLFTQTRIGLLWGLLVGLSLIGFIMLRATAGTRVVWAAALLVLESFSGHAAAYEPRWYSILLDVVHLGASAVWAGGLVFLLVLWFEERKDAGRFALQFTRAAWICIFLLTVTGVLSAVLFLPRLDYLFYTSWGYFLLAKTGFVLLVVVVGALLRRQVKRGDLPNQTLLRIDASLMALIIIAVGIFTYISPLPANEPLSRHLMGEQHHFTLRITPNVPTDDNQFLVKVWLPEELGEPKSVRLLLRSLDQESLGPIEVPLEKFEDEEIDTFTGFVKATYQAKGPYIPFAGNWRAEIRVFDQQDNETVHPEIFRNY